ncbi:hypothetical protein GUY60_27575 [Streptomyces sp. YC537]|uniref:Uncharacterized protein n=1 Tax=Streptomyces boluensis TaxID=1775135 RepID=A0A964XPC9_9ACTN|nr:hypothetical protein [Streptomyces boluensis]
MPVLLASLALFAVPLVTAGQHARPAPYGDRLTVHARVQSDTAAEPALRTRGRTLQAYDPGTGRARWTHARVGHRPLAVLPTPGHALALWDDGLVTDTERRTGRSVRWHRAIPAGADWLRTPEARGGAGVLRTLDPRARMVAVVTPRRIAAYRTADGDLRWVLPAEPGCAFEPSRAVHHGPALLVAQPCGAATSAWPEQLTAVDDLGRIAPGRKPLGNALPGAAAAQGTAQAPEKVVAHHR